MTEPIDKSFWETKHNSNEIWWISGTGFNTMMNQHKLAHDDFKNKKILEIGVGTGSMSAVLPKYSSEIYCCDISQSALDNVKQYATQVFLTENLKEIPLVDLAFSHLVFQHCTDEEILRIGKWAAEYCEDARPDYHITNETFEYSMMMADVKKINGKDVPWEPGNLLNNQSDIVPDVEVEELIKKSKNGGTVKEFVVRIKKLLKVDLK